MNRTQLKTNSEKESFGYQIKAMNREIDELIFKLYELPQETITVVKTLTKG
jgi:hypothetical protein